MMSGKQIYYTIKSATAETICDHLQQSNETFIPVLSSRVNIEDYAKKLSCFSITFEAWCDEKLVGLIAAYFNNLTSKAAYISSVSVLKPYQGMGIAKRLVSDCITYAVEKQFEKILLEVNKNNIEAIRLYAGAGFKMISENGSMCLMGKIIGG